MQQTAIPRSETAHRIGDREQLFAVRSLILIWIRCDKTSRKTVPFWTVCAPAIGNCRSYRTTVGDRATQLMDPMQGKPETEALRSRMECKHEPRHLAIIERLYSEVWLDPFRETHGHGQGSGLSGEAESRVAGFRFAPFAAAN